MCYSCNATRGVAIRVSGAERGKDCVAKRVIDHFADAGNAPAGVIHGTGLGNS